MKSKYIIAPISVFWTLAKVSVFMNTWYYLSWHSYISKSCSDFVAPHIKYAKTICLIEIKLQELCSLHQCFLDFGEKFYEYLISLVIMIISSVLFVKSVQTLLQDDQISRNPKHFVSLYFRAFGALDTVLFVKVIQTLVHHISGSEHTLYEHIFCWNPRLFIFLKSVFSGLCECLQEFLISVVLML